MRAEYHWGPNFEWKYPIFLSIPHSTTSLSLCTNSAVHQVKYCVHAQGTLYPSLQDMFSNHPGSAGRLECLPSGQIQLIYPIHYRLAMLGGNPSKAKIEESSPNSRYTTCTNFFISKPRDHRSLFHIFWRKYTVPQTVIEKNFPEILEAECCAESMKIFNAPPIKFLWPR